MASQHGQGGSVRISLRTRLNHLRLVSADAPAAEASVDTPAAVASEAAPEPAPAAPPEPFEPASDETGLPSAPAATANDTDDAWLQGASDDELMLMTNGGARAAFDALIRRHQARAIGIANRQTGNMALAVDIAQEAFVDLLEAAPRYQPLGKFDAFLARIVTNRCRMEFRRSGRWRRASDSAMGELRFVETGLDVVLERERERRLNEAIRALSRPLREVIVLWIEGLKDRQIAEALRTAEGTVRSRRFAAIAKLRSILGGL